MRKAKILFILGIFIAVLPYLGFPYSWKEAIFTLSGLGLVYLSYMIHRESKKTENKEKAVFDNFQENHNFSEN